MSLWAERHSSRIVHKNVDFSIDAYGCLQQSLNLRAIYCVAGHGGEPTLLRLVGVEKDLQAAIQFEAKAFCASASWRLPRQTNSWGRFSSWSFIWVIHVEEYGCRPVSSGNERQSLRQDPWRYARVSPRRALRHRSACIGSVTSLPFSRIISSAGPSLSAAVARRRAFTSRPRPYCLSAILQLPVESS
jgi:hypothetical protein